jgi:meiotic recombination protein SPO11
MEHLYQRIKMNSYGTKREVYYNDTQFYLNQLIVDTLVSQVELILGCCRNSFHISPSPRGQIFGSLVMKVGGFEINYLNYNSSHGQLMPCADDDIEIVECTAKYIIIVEKDTIFHRLLSEYCDKIIGPHILMTSKGYPDYNTRMLLRFLNEHLFLPVLYFGDCDPFGIDIFTLYAFGSNVRSLSSVIIAIQFCYIPLI